MPLITVSQSGSDIPPGVYPVILASIEGPKTIVPQSGPNAGKEVDILSWNFVVSDGEWQDTEIEATTSTSSGPRSKLYGFLTALFGGTPPPTGASFEAKDLSGRVALATIDRTESGWPRIVNLGAMPATMLAQHVGRVTGAPLAAQPVSGPPVVPQQVATPQAPPPGYAPNLQPSAPGTGQVSPLRQQVAAGAADGLPF
jgi:hypothetical protein